MLVNTLLIFLALAVTVLILVPDNWRWNVFGLVMCYLIGFVLIVQIWPLSLAAVKLLTGFIGMVVLSTVKINTPELPAENRSRSYRIFLVLVLSVGWIIVTATTAKLNEWLPIAYTNLYIGLVILFAGIIKFAVSRQVFDVVVGLLVFLCGFDVVYSSLEGSALVTAIYSLIVLAICVIGSYLEGFSIQEEEA
ncbi:MAG: hypothetical protein HPY72_05700 [Anaerolineae bacterium]|nr:hypothetical protein [Anaerolineae bacterium]